MESNLLPVLGKTPGPDTESRWTRWAEFIALLALFFVYAGDPPPAVNEAHYLVKAQNFWDPSFCANDLFAASGKAHTTFYWTFGVLTRWFSLTTTAWVGRLVGWGLLAAGLMRCCRSIRLPRFASLGVAIVWLVGLEYFNLAGEWVVGGIEAKVPAYGFVLLGIAEVCQRRWSRGWVWFGAASAFHVLTGGWAVVASTIAFAITERLRPPEGQTKQAFFTPGLFLGGALALFGLIPALQLTFGASTEASVMAAKIYSYVRIRHHLLPGDFPAHWFARHAVLIAGLFVLAWKTEFQSEQRRLLWVGFGAIAISACGLVIGALPAFAPDLAARLLRYYWFRLGDALVPLVFAFALMYQFHAKPNHCSRGPTRPAAWSCLAIACGLFVWSCYDRIRTDVAPSVSHRLLGIATAATPAQQRQSFADWLTVCDWIRVATPENEVFLTPRHQQTFKWYAHRAEVVNWKDVPQDAQSLLEWQNRFDDVFPKRLGTVAISSMRVPISYIKLREYRQRYGVRFMVVDNRVATDQLPLVRIYPTGNQTNATYSVYELPYR